jgi:hypothetical protein
MKVYDILAEEKVEEGPLDMIGRAMGSKKAQLSHEIDTEVKSLWKEYSAIVSQDPKAPGKMTISNIANFLKNKGFISSPQEVGAFIKANPSLMQRIGSMAGSVADKITKGASAIAGTMKTAKDAVKTQMNKKSGLAPAGESLEAELQNQLIYEATAPQEIDKRTAMMILKKFVQKGFQAQVGNRVNKSAYGDDPAQQDGIDSSRKNQMVQAAIADLQKMGYTVTKNK